MAMEATCCRTSASHAATTALLSVAGVRMVERGLEEAGQEPVSSAEGANEGTVLGPPRAADVTCRMGLVDQMPAVGHNRLNTGC